MLKSILTIAIVMLTSASVGCSQQVMRPLPPQPLPPPPPPPIKRVGKAEILYSPKTNRSQVRIYAYILGTSLEVPERKKEVITMEMGYSIPGQEGVVPGSVFLRLRSYSPDVPKYRDNHNVTIIVDGKVLLDGEGFDWDADDRSTASEAYGIGEMSFSDFEMMAKAKNLSIQLGATTVDITGEPLDAIRDLLKTVER